MPGYSGTPLAKKVGIKNGYRVLTVRAPDGFVDWLEPLPQGARVSNRFGRADIALVFATSVSEMDGVMSRVLKSLPPDGAVWICWPKKASGIVSELQSRDVMLPPLFDRGLVDVKVAAISDVWSGLKFVLRMEYR